jgi:hypothetical protein
MPIIGSQPVYYGGTLPYGYLANGVGVPSPQTVGPSGLMASPAAAGTSGSGAPTNEVLVQIVQAWVQQMMQALQALMMPSVDPTMLSQGTMATPSLGGAKSGGTHGGGGGSVRHPAAAAAPPVSAAGSLASPALPSPPAGADVVLGEDGSPALPGSSAQIIETTEDLTGNNDLPNSQMIVRQGDQAMAQVGSGASVYDGGDHKVEVEVRDAAGNPIANAPVAFSNNNGGAEVITMTTDANGHAKMDLYKNDRYKVSYLDATVYNVTSKSGKGNGQQGEEPTHTPVKIVFTQKPPKSAQPQVAKAKTDSPPDAAAMKQASKPNPSSSA